MKLFRLPFTHHTPGSLGRRVAERAAADWHLPGETGDDVLLVTTELMQNAIQHTRDGGELSLARAPGLVLVEVADTSEQLPRLADPVHGGLRGRGLRLVAEIARRWGARLRPGGKVVWAELAAEEAVPPRSPDAPGKS